MIQSTQVPVSTTPVLLGSGGGNGITINIYNSTGTACFLGGGTSVAASGTANGGFQLGGSQYLTNVEVQRGDTLYGVTASGTTTLHILRGGV